MSVFVLIVNNYSIIESVNMKSNTYKYKDIVMKIGKDIWDWIILHYRQILSVLGALFIWLNFESKWLDIFDKCLLPYMNVSCNGLATAITLLLFCVVFVKCCIAFKNRYVCAFSHVLLLLFVLSVYIRYRFSGLYEYELIIGDIAYLDIYAFISSLPILVTIINSLRLKFCKKKTISSKANFIFDYPITDKSEDKLNYSREAESLAKKIIDCDNKKSLSIGVISAWGVGKTSFLNLVKQSLNNKVILVNFNPRHSKSPKDIQEDFFVSLANILKTYNSKLSTIIRDYMNALQLLDHRNIVSAIQDLLKNDDKVAIKEKLSDVLANLPKKVVVVIDDFDRLTKEEILEIFKLIDGNASFPNIVFITAYDKAYVAKLVEDTYTNDNANFSDKFFNLEVTVPLRSYKEFFTFFVETLLNGINAPKEDTDKYLNVLSKHLEILEKYLPTMRDIKRFLNLFLKDYIPLIGEVDFEDYFLLTIIKYKNPNEHLLLFKLKKGLKPPMLHSRYIYDDKTNHEFGDILKIIFPEVSHAIITETHQTYRKIYSFKAFDNYFVNGIFGVLKQQEMKDTLSADMEIATPIMEKWKRDNSLGDFVDFVLSRNMMTFQSDIDFGAFVDKVLYLAYYYPDGQLYWTVLSLLYENSATELCKLYKIDINEYKSIILNKLRSKQPNYNHYILRKLILNYYDHEFDEKPILLTKEELQQINCEHARLYINETTEMDDTTMWLLYSCVDAVDPISRKVTLDEGCCNLVKDKIVEQPQFYISKFVRLGMYSPNQEYNSIACEPFWEQIFGSAKEFEKFINDKKYDDIDKIERVRRFWELYKNNDYQRINFEGQGNVQEMIDSDLDMPYSKLQKLVDLKSKFNKLQTETTNESNKVESYKSIIDEIQKVNLNIALSDKLIKDITSTVGAINGNPSK